MAQDTLVIYGDTFTNVTGIKATDDQDGTKVYIRPTGNINISQAGQTDVTNYATATVPSATLRAIEATADTDISVDSDGLVSVVTAYDTGSAHPVSASGWVDSTASLTVEVSATDTYQLPTQGATTITPTTSAQTAVTAGKFTTGAVTVAAMPTGTAGTPTATKGTVSNHSVSVTPSVTNSAGYISGGTINGTAVSVSASELVSGTYTVDSAGTKDVTNYASASVPTASYYTALSGNAFYTENNQRKWHIRPLTDLDITEGDVEGWIGNGSQYGDYYEVNAVPANTTITPSTSAQTVGGQNYMMEGAVTVAAMPTGTAGTPTATKGTVSNHSVSVTPSVTNTSGYITGSTKTGTAVTVSASELVSGSQTITQNGTVDVTNLASVVVSVEGGGGSSAQVDTVARSPGGDDYTAIFTGLKGQPTSFYVSVDVQANTTAQALISAVVYDGSSIHTQTITNTTNAQVSYVSTGVSYTYSNGTLTVTSTGPIFVDDDYALTYTYGGSASDVDTFDVQVGSGATSITFTGLADEPIAWSCIFKSNFSTSSGYQRVIATGYNGTSVIGLAMDSAAHPSNSYWTQSYSNGSLTITSQGTNAGGYFHQPGYYQLTAVYGDVEPQEIDVVPLSVTTNGTYTAPSGTAYSPVTVNVSGGSVNVATTTWSNTDASATTHTFTGLSGTPKAAFLRCTSSLSRSSSSSNYFVADMRWTGTATAGNSYRRSNGSYANVTSGYSFSASGTSLTVTTTGTSTSNPGSFYNGTYELTYIY